MAEMAPIRLVIWDPDETLWQGRLADGAVRAIAPHQDLVIELCRRGILSSICARSDFEPMRRLLRTFGLWDFFLYPSIDWSPKPARIERIIAATQIAPSSVLFIDDNAANLAAAKALIPDLQVASPELLTSIHSDPRFAGEDDPQLACFTRYKVLEQQQAGRGTAPEPDGRDTAQPLGVVVTIETDVAAHIDRAVELVRRTDRLNFTKARLPADLPSARQELLNALADARAGLVRVSDDHDDHGLCGFYLMRGEELEHFCFSSRIVGMGVENWVHDQLGRPPLLVPTDIPTHLQRPGPAAAINEGMAAAPGGSAEIPEIVLRGGPELEAVARFCSLNSGKVVFETNRREWHVVLSQNSTTNLALSLRKQDSEALRELHVIGFREADLASRYWSVPANGIGIFSGWADLESPRYRHISSGLETAFRFDLLPADFAQVTEQQIADFAEAKRLTPETTDHVRQFVGYFAQNYEFLPTPVEQAKLRANLHAIFSAFPWSARLFVLLPDARRLQGKTPELQDRPEARAYNELVRAIAAAYRHVEVIDLKDFAGEPGRPIDPSRRETGLRLYRAIIEANGAAQSAA
jgi:FkbH-like protein